MTRRKKRTLLALGGGALVVLTAVLGCPRGPGAHTGEALPTVLEGHRLPVQALAFGPDGDTLASAAYYTSDSSSEVEVTVWDAGTAGQRARHTIPPRDLFWLCFAPGGQKFAAVGKDRGVWLGDTTSARRLGESPAPVLALAFSAAAGLLATADAENVVTFWDVTDGRSRSCVKAVLPVRALAFTPDGTTLAVGDGKTVRLWDVATGEELGALPGQTHPIVALAFSPDGRTLADGDLYGVVRLWDVATRTGQGTLGAAGGDDTFLNEVSALAFAPDGRSLAVAVGRRVRLWDVATGSLVARLEGHEGKVKCLAYSPDGARLASGGYDQKVRLWDAARHQPKHGP